MEIIFAIAGSVEFTALTALVYDEVAPAGTAADDGSDVNGREAGSALVGWVGRDDDSAGAAGDEGGSQTVDGRAGWIGHCHDGC